MHGHGALRAEGLLPPDGAVDGVGPKDPAGALQQQAENVVLRGRQADRLPVQGHGLALVVQADAPGPQLIPLRRHRAQLSIAPQLRAHPGQQLHGVEGLGHIVVRAQVQAEDLVRVLALGRQKDHRHVAVLPQTAERGDAVQAGHHDVQQHQLHLLPGEKCQRLLSVMGAEGLVALRLQIDFQRRDDIPLVVADQHLVHACAPPVVFSYMSIPPRLLRTKGVNV